MPGCHCSPPAQHENQQQVTSLRLRVAGPAPPSPPVPGTDPRVLVVSGIFLNISGVSHQFISPYSLPCVPPWSGRRISALLPRCLEFDP
ncbi:hypothetical protein ElyMa_000754500 [Elysia marginata]|uniref:Uncharacterized protein n=1 Tax=Elysia marginata TaxID=1093978 RepID=A0AAV4GQD3_9GAST|nr:hypothetical protein ElyMa_000754500 [Elysia marginata]